MIDRFSLVKRKPVAAVIVCAIIVAAAIMFWPAGQVAEAAILDPHPGLVGWWRFDEGTGTTAEDSSGYGNNGTVYGAATWVQGKHGEALSLDGTDDYVNCGNDASLNLTDEFTVQAWINPDVLAVSGETYSIIVGRWSAWILCLRDNGEIILANWGGEGDQESSGVNVQTGVWQQVAVAYSLNAGYAYFYKNGDYVSRDAITVAAGNSRKPTEIGGTKSGTRQQFDGAIDEIRIYNRALSAAEIETLFQKGPDFSSRLLTKVPKGTTEFIVTLSWQGVGGMNVTIESPSENYTEDVVPVYQRTDYSSSSGDILNIKRLSVSTTALLSDEKWYIVLEFYDVENYKMTVEVQR